MSKCALCATVGLAPLFTLPNIPLSHHLRKSEAEPDPRFTLEFASCPKCGLMQITNPIDPGTIYADADTYTTGFQKPRHIDDLITTAIARQDPGSVLDVGCNDGALMEKLKDQGYRVIVGIEPNRVAAEKAFATGHYVFRGYLNEAWANKFKGEFHAIYCRHVIEHVTDIGAFMRAIRTVLRDDGQLVIEMPDCEEAFALGSPAILWEEHVSYFTPALLSYMLHSFGFDITDQRRYAFGGGSMAVVARKRNKAAAFGSSFGLAAEGKIVANHFGERLEAQMRALNSLINKARYHGYTILMYGAAPRSVMVAAVCQIADVIDVVVDDRIDLRGRLFPGTRLPIQAVRDVRDQPTLCLLGVGAENEAKVRARLNEWCKQAVYVSLFAPRDTLASIEAARRQIEGVALAAE